MQGRKSQSVADLVAKVNDLEATVMLMGSELDQSTRAFHDLERRFEKLASDVERMRSEGLGPLPKPEDDRPPHY